MGKIIEMKNVGKEFVDARDSVEALVDVNLHVMQNEFVSMLGPSGCGKSTLLKIIAGLDGDYTGSVVVGGKDIKHQKPSVCLMHQRDLLMPWKNVMDNVTLPLMLQGIGKHERDEKAAMMFSEFGLAGFEQKYPKQLSGGMRQRAALLRTFLCEGDVFLMDEPFAALDWITRFKMRQWLLDIWNHHKKAVVFVTHDIEEAVYLSDRIYILSERPATVVKEVVVDIPRPREKSILERRDFLDIRRGIQNAL